MIGAIAQLIVLRLLIWGDNYLLLDESIAFLLDLGVYLRKSNFQR